MRMKKGFTLVEMLVVIAIIAVLVSIVVPAVSGAVLKASAAANAANLRAVQSTVQTDYMANPEKYGNALITKADDGVLLFGEQVSFDAPVAKAVSAGSMNVPAGTQMMVRIQQDSSVVATYAGFDLGDFETILGGGDISNLDPSIIDGILGGMESDEIFDILEGIINGSQQTPETGVEPYDPPIYVDVYQLKNFMATALMAGERGSDCVTCDNSNRKCIGYTAIPDANGKSYLCDVCGHAPGVHFTPVYMDVAGQLIGLVQCQTGTPHQWNEQHVCAVSGCVAEYPVKQHVYENPDSLNCVVCNYRNQEAACQQGIHVYNRDGVCDGCGEMPKQIGACDCTTFAMAGMYCVNCGHGTLDHFYEDYSFGSCKFGHTE